MIVHRGRDLPACVAKQALPLPNRHYCGNSRHVPGTLAAEPHAAFENSHRIFVSMSTETPKLSPVETIKEESEFLKGTIDRRDRRADRSLRQEQHSAVEISRHLSAG